MMPRGFLMRKLRRVLNTNRRVQQAAGILLLICAAPFVIFAEMPLWTAVPGACFVAGGWVMFERAADTDKRKAARELATMKMEAADE